MSLHTEFDKGSLIWVKGEIEDALGRTRESLQQYAEAGADATLKHAQTYLHQVCGALTLVDLPGFSRFCEELEQAVAGLDGHLGGKHLGLGHGDHQLRLVGAGIEQLLRLDHGGQFLFCAGGVLLQCRVGAGAAQKPDAFDQLGAGLQNEQQESGWDHQARRPHRQAAGAVGHFIAQPGVDEDRPGQNHDRDRHRQEEEEDAQDVDPGLAAAREAVGDQVDANVFVAQ